MTSLHSPPSFSLSLSLSLLKPTKYHQVAGAPGRPQRVLQHQCVLSAIFGSAGGDHEGAHSVGCALPKPSAVGDLRFLFIPEGLRRGSRLPQVTCFRWMRRTDILAASFISYLRCWHALIGAAHAAVVASADSVVLQWQQERRFHLT